ncbi:hypothetical protein HX52_12185 [Salmonella enterica]|uniref:Uncharacterized protein n=1 Tax=Salmonella enterica subsp. houtenae serovar 1,40:z4,z32:- TaxID=1967604 RepID=A0A730WEX0_SALHO|nr:hypothetical protein [Salmonella enterica]EBW8656487.1 hypothetical protein [Salmonella enterica subsp. enterica serovar Anatum]ECC3553344.1 hypothetical protein [Salmonella enterica subsp. salamae]ECR3218139.1 hypothetical protein [Salmonella enterica subsp. enterica]EDL1104080.1 hypothetical protein [Salmonella enterica subsp. enterica serovar Typhimurium]EDS1357904.1 hypothetical protein [Salmonella enterica subsp. enterica serovar Tennessee]HAC6700725.1 hypothetical protein [Salmonella
MNKVSVIISFIAVAISILSLLNTYLARRKANENTIRALKMELLKDYYEIENRIANIELTALISKNRWKGVLKPIYMKEIDETWGEAKQFADSFKKSNTPIIASIDTLSERELVAFHQKLLAVRPGVMIQHDLISENIKKFDNKMESLLDKNL